MVGAATKCSYSTVPALLCPACHVLILSARESTHLIIAWHLSTCPPRSFPFRSPYVSERGFSCMNLLKTARRQGISTKLLCILMVICQLGSEEVPVNDIIDI